jgi:putative membrane protein
MMYDGYNNGGGAGYSWVFMVLMMALVFLAVVLVFHYLNRSAHSANKEDAALEIIKTRYAKGEMEKKEFDEKRKDLKA